MALYTISICSVCLCGSLRAINRASQGHKGYSVSGNKI